MSAQSTDGTTWKDPIHPSLAFVAAVGTSTLETVVEDEFETFSGWEAGDPGDDATSGHWQWVDPIGTTAQPADDHTEDPAKPA